MTSLLRIGGALLVGTFFVLGALVVKENLITKGSGTVVNANTSENGYIATKDADKDGTPDWEENLQEIFVEKAQLASTTRALYASNEPYTPPTTFTGKFSEAFFKDYLDGKIQGEDFTDPSAFVGTAVKAIEENTAARTYTKRDISIIPSTESGIRSYGNDLASINLRNSIGNENEALILQRALEANDPKILEDLAPIRAVYETMIKETLALSVPDTFADEHVGVLNAYSAILTDIAAMQVAFEDPLLALARITTYKADALTLYNAFKALNTALSDSGVVFTSDEPGSFFYIFER